MAAGDSVGATPPISNFFGDTPTIEIMNMMGVDIDGLGNHNFDRGVGVPPEHADPARGLPVRLVEHRRLPTGKTPAEWSKSLDVQAPDGAQARLRRLHQRRRPVARQARQLRPVRRTCRTRLTPSTPRRRRSRKKVNGVVAIGHLGATGGTLTAPTGPLLDLADDVSNVSIVIGDHTDQQVLTTRSNGVLVTENRSKGLRFTRIRIVLGAANDGVVYKTADFHKPWDIGVTPDPAIQAKIDDLNAQLLPIFSTQVGESNVVVPRADACGRRRRARTAGHASRSSATSSPTRCASSTPPISRSPTRAASGPT